jgi:hypothetical protein
MFFISVITSLIHNGMPFSYDFTDKIQMKYYPKLYTKNLVLIDHHFLNTSH